MSGPAVLIVLGIEAKPSVRFDCLDEAEPVRLVEWVESRPGYVELIGRAFELAETEQAA